MAGANNAQLKTAGWKARDITKARATAIGALSHAKMRKMGHTPKRFSHQAKVGGALKKAAQAAAAAHAEGALGQRAAQAMAARREGGKDTAPVKVGRDVYEATLGGTKVRIVRGSVGENRYGERSKAPEWKVYGGGKGRPLAEGEATMKGAIQAARRTLGLGEAAPTGGKRTMISARSVDPTSSQRKTFADAGFKVDVRGGDPKLSTARHLRPPRTRTSLYVERADGKPMTANDRRAAKELASRLGLARGE